MTGYIAVLARVNSEWREVLLDENQRLVVHELLTQMFDGRSIPISETVLSLSSTWSDPS